jgi:hypothetical protein
MTGVGMRPWAHRWLLRLLAALALLPCAAAQAAGDPPLRVGRVSWLAGEVTAVLAPGAAETPAQVNLPVTSGFALRTAERSRAEWRVGATAVQVNARSEFTLQRLDDGGLVIALAHGNLALHVHGLAAGEQVEVIANGLPLRLLAPGSYHVGVGPLGRRAELRVFEGRAQVALAAGPLVLGVGQQALFDVGGAALVSQGSAERTPFDDWAARRVERFEGSPAAHYLGAEMTGAEALDAHGAWRLDPRFGPLWFPRAVDNDWAPYRAGRWVELPPWGWTWVDDAPWGFAPSHYGRWVFVAGRWGWSPGPAGARSAWAPALVGFYGSGDGGRFAPAAQGEVVGWFPLAPGEAYRPAYGAGATYLQRLNAGMTAPAAAPRRWRYAQTSFAATAMPRAAFDARQPVRAARLALTPALLTAAAVRPVDAPAAAR